MRVTVTIRFEGAAASSPLPAQLMERIQQALGASAQQPSDEITLISIGTQGDMAASAGIKSQLISDLDLTPRTHELLYGDGFRSIAELAAPGIADTLLYIPRFGMKKLIEVMRAAREFGVLIGPPQDPRYVLAYCKQLMQMSMPTDLPMPVVEDTPPPITADTPIDHCGLSPRVASALQTPQYGRAGTVRTAGDLTQYEEEALRGFRLIGDGAIDEIKAMLGRAGLSLKPCWQAPCG